MTIIAIMSGTARSSRSSESTAGDAVTSTSALSP